MNDELLNEELKQKLLATRKVRQEIFDSWFEDIKEADRRVLGFFDTKYPFRKPILIDGVIIWPYCSIHPDAVIGEGSVIGHGVNITGPVKIGKYARIQSFVFIPEGLTIEDQVFIGPGTIFTNVKYPKVRAREPKIYSKTLVKKGANIGAGCIIGSDITIGENSTIGMGSVVLKDVKGNYIVRGYPAHHVREFLGSTEAV